MGPHSLREIDFFPEKSLPQGVWVSVGGITRWTWYLPTRSWSTYLENPVELKSKCQASNHQMSKKAWEFPVLVTVPNMDTPYSPQWNGEDRARYHGEDCVLHNSKGTMHIVFHMKGAPWNWVMPHLGAGLFLSSQEISGGGLHLASSPQPSSGLELLLWTNVRNEEPPHQNTSARVFSYLMMSSLEIPVSGSSCQHSLDLPNVLHCPAEIHRIGP